MSLFVFVNKSNQVCVSHVYRRYGISIKHFLNWLMFTTLQIYVQANVHPKYVWNKLLHTFILLQILIRKNTITRAYTHARVHNHSPTYTFFTHTHTRHTLTAAHTGIHNPTTRKNAQHIINTPTHSHTVQHTPQ